MKMLKTLTSQELEMSYFLPKLLDQSQIFQTF